MSDAPSPAADGPERSPPLLSPPPRRGQGVRRLNWVPILLVAAGAMLVVAAIGYTYRDRMMQAAANRHAAEQKTPEPANDAAILSAAPPDGEVQPAVDRVSAPHPASRPVQPAPVTATPTDHRSADAPQGDSDAATARRQAWQAYYAEVRQVRKDRVSAARSAMAADTGLTNGQHVAGNGSHGVTRVGLAISGVPNLQQGYGATDAVPGGYAVGGGLPVTPPAGIDAAGQREKQAFLAQPGDTMGPMTSRQDCVTRSRPTWSWPVRLFRPSWLAASTAICRAWSSDRWPKTSTTPRPAAIC